MSSSLHSILFVMIYGPLNSVELFFWVVVNCSDKILYFCSQDFMMDCG